MNERGGGTGTGRGWGGLLLRLVFFPFGIVISVFGYSYLLPAVSGIDFWYGYTLRSRGYALVFFFLFVSFAVRLDALISSLMRSRV